MAGIYTSDEAFYLFVSPLKQIADQRVEAELENPRSVLSELYRRMEQVERAHGLSGGDFWRLDQAPREYRELNQQWQKLVDEITLAVFAGVGEHEVARFYRSDPAEFRRRMIVGRHSFEQRHAAAQYIA